MTCADAHQDHQAFGDPGDHLIVDWELRWLAGWDMWDRVHLLQRPMRLVE